jgi:hypothetical protein
VVVNADLGAWGAREALRSHVITSAIEAVCLLMINSLDLETLMELSKDAAFVGVNDRTLCIRARMNEAACLSLLNTAGIELPPRSRITTTTLRLLFWFRAKRRSRRYSFC